MPADRDIHQLTEAPVCAVGRHAGIRCAETTHLLGEELGSIIRPLLPFNIIYSIFKDACSLVHTAVFNDQISFDCPNCKLQVTKSEVCMFR